MFETAQRGIAVNEAVKRFVSSSWYCFPDTVPLPGNDFVNQSLRQQLIEVSLLPGPAPGFFLQVTK